MAMRALPRRASPVMLAWLNVCLRSAFAMPRIMLSGHPTKTNGPGSDELKVSTVQFSDSLDNQALQQKVAHFHVPHGNHRKAVREDLDQPDHTDWRESFMREGCARRTGRIEYFPNPIYRYQAPLVYSPTFKLAYMKTPSVASEAFFSYFFNYFADAEYVPGDNPLPGDTFVFTFVGSPLRRILTSYAEADMLRQIEESTGMVHGDDQPDFASISRKQNGGVDRFSQYLDDLSHKRFGSSTERRNWQPESAALQVAGIMNCKNNLSFVGHIERVGADWLWIQKKAGVPQANISTATLAPRSSEARQDDVHMPSKHILDSTEVVRQICDMYALDFVCLGYQTPPDCWRNFTVDDAIYRSVDKPALAVDVKRKVNRLLARHSMRNITGGAAVKDVFEDPAPGKAKEIFIKKGHREIVLSDKGGERRAVDISSLLPPFEH